MEDQHIDDEHADEHADDASPDETPVERRSTLSIVLVLAGIVAVSTIIAVLSSQTDQDPNGEDAGSVRRDESIQRGIACPDLEVAAERFAAGDQPGFTAAIQRAGREAEDALQRDGVNFGRPERAALELSSLVSSGQAPSDARVQEIISDGVDACRSGSA
jgi:hypothetical protein